jgi:hypothetical protein
VTPTPGQRPAALAGAGVWDDTEAFLQPHTDTTDTVGRMAGVSLALLRQLRPRWERSLDCHPATGLGLVFSRHDAPGAHTVRAEPSVEGTTEPTVVVSLLSGQASPADPGAVVGGDICSAAKAPEVVGSFLAQIAAPATLAGH